MAEVSQSQLIKAIQATHGCATRLAGAVPVLETFEGQTVWEGVVHVFDLQGHPTANQCFAWSTVVHEKTQRRRFYTVLGEGPIKTAQDAVKAAIVAEHKGEAK